MADFQKSPACDKFELCEYIAKCLTGVGIVFLLFATFPQEKDLSLWLLVSMLISITHDNNSTAAKDRMRANIIGSFVGLVTFLVLPPPHLLAVFLGVAVTILICFKLDLMQVCRTALVGLVLVLAYEKVHSDWKGAIFRMASVVAGCLLGLIINYLFRRLSLPVMQRLRDRNRP